MPCVFACNCQKKTSFPSEVSTWRSLPQNKPGFWKLKKELGFLERHEYKQYFSAHFLAFSSRLAWELFHFFSSEVGPGENFWRRKKNSAWVSADKLKWTCFEEGLYCTFKNWKAALFLRTPFFSLHCGGGKTTRVSPFLEGSGDAIKSLQENQWPETFYM